MSRRIAGEHSVEDSIASMRASFRRMGVEERDVRVTWDSEALWARVRFLIPHTEPRQAVEYVVRYDESRHERSHRAVLWDAARRLDQRSRRVKKGESLAVAFEGVTTG